MWLDNLKKIKQEKNLSTPQLAEKANLPEKTVSRILKGTTANPYLDTLDRLAHALDCSIGDLLADTGVVIGNASLTKLQADLDGVTAEKETIAAERDLAVAEINIMKEKINALTAENELLKLKLLHKEELLAVHTFYNKFDR
jgi:transcriptional regulator with XRE-family HTH domain